MFKQIDPSSERFDRNISDLKTSEISRNMLLTQLRCNFNMQKLLSVLLLLAFSYSQTTVLNSDTTTMIGNFPATVVPSFARGFLRNATGIWNSQGNLSPAGTTVTFTKTFYLNCKGPVTLLIAAFGNYNFLWDGVNVRSGGGPVLSRYPLTAGNLCGSRNLTIVVTKTGNWNVSGLIFSLIQDQSGCFKCNSNGFWNDLRCGCECLQENLCGCPSIIGSSNLKVWAAFPTCACICPATVPSTGILNIATTGAAFGRLCPAGQYYSQAYCRCRCKVQYCPPRFQYRDDPINGCGCMPVVG